MPEQLNELLADAVVVNQHGSTLRRPDVTLVIPGHLTL
jgi:hypothetical protein